MKTALNKKNEEEECGIVFLSGPFSLVGFLVLVLVLVLVLFYYTAHCIYNFIACFKNSTLQRKYLYSFFFHSIKFIILFMFTLS